MNAQESKRRTDGVNREPYEVRDWAKKFGVSEDARRTAVVQVGSMAVEAMMHGRTYAAAVGRIRRSSLTAIQAATA